MLKKICTLWLLLTTCYANAQNYKLTWGEEMKLKKGTIDMDIVAADASGIYLSEGHLRATSYFVVGATFKEEQKLMKVDRDFNILFDKVYRKELKGLTFHSFQLLENELFLFATDYDRKTKSFTVFGTRINKSSGEMMDALMPLGAYNLESKKDKFELKLDTINGGKNFMMVSDISGKDRTSLAVEILDKRLQKKQSTIINLSYAPGRYSLQDVKYTHNKKIVLLGKEMDEVQLGRRKRKRIVFKQYALAIYNPKGTREKDVAVDAGSRFIIGGKLIEQADHNLLLAGFYSNDAKKEDLHGFYINRLDVSTGVLSLSSYKEITPSMLGRIKEDGAADKDDGDDEEETGLKKDKANEDDDVEEFPNSFIIRSVATNPTDGSYVITSEVSQYSSYTYEKPYRSNGQTQTKSVTVHQFTNNDILVINASADGNIRWLNAIPKSQQEEIYSSANINSGFSFRLDYSGYFVHGGGMPYYSSYNSLIHKNQLIILMNDHEDNKNTTEWGSHVKRIMNFKSHSNIYGVSIDLATGKMTRKIIAANSPDLVLMPRHSYVLQDEVVIPSMRPKMFGKTELKVAKVVVQ